MEEKQFREEIIQEFKKTRRTLLGVGYASFVMGLGGWYLNWNVWIVISFNILAITIFVLDIIWGKQYGEWYR